MKEEEYKMSRKLNWVCSMSVFFLLSSYFTFPVQIIAQEVLEENLVIENFTKTSEITETKEEASSIKEITNESMVDFENSLEEETGLIDFEDFDYDHENIGSVIKSSDLTRSDSTLLITLKSTGTLTEMDQVLTAANYDVTTIKSITLAGVTSLSGSIILHSVLGKYTSLEYFELRDVVSLGNYSLSGASSIEHLYLPKAESIGTGALRGMSNLNRLEAPEVTSIGSGNFDQGYNRLNYLITPKWGNIDQNLFDDYAKGTLLELSSGSFSSPGMSGSEFQALRKQTINRDPGNSASSIAYSDGYTVFINVRELIVRDFSELRSNQLNGSSVSVVSLSSDSITSVNLQVGFDNLSNIDFDEQLTALSSRSFAGTQITTLNLASLKSVSTNQILTDATALKEVYLPSLTTYTSISKFDIPSNLKFVGLSSSNIDIFRGWLSTVSPSTLFAVTDEITLPLRDREIPAGETVTLEADLSSFMLNDSFENTEFSAEYTWYFEGTEVGDDASYTISNMNESNSGSYNYRVNIKGSTGLSFSTSLESEKAQVGLEEEEVYFTSNFSVNSVVGDLQELEVPFKSNVTNSNSTFTISIPESLKVDDENIEIYLTNFSSVVPLGVTVVLVDQVITISNFSLIAGVNYYINIPIMPISLSEQTDEIKVEFLGNSSPVEVFGEVSIASGEFNVSIPNQINFGEVSIDSSHINSNIEKIDPLNIDVISFTGIEETWEIMVSATPFKNQDGKEIDENIIRLVYHQDEDVKNLSDELLFSKGSFTGKLSYDFQTNLWENNSFIISQMQHEGFKIFVGNEYYKLEEKQLYTAEVNFAIQYSP